MLVNSSDIERICGLSKKQSQHIMNTLRNKISLTYKMAEADCGNKYKTVKGRISRPHFEIDDAIAFFSQYDPRGYVQRSRAKYLKLLKRIKDKK